MSAVSVCLTPSVFAEDRSFDKEFALWEKTGFYGEDLLLQASEDGDTDFIRYLVKDKKISVNCKDGSGRTPLLAAARFNRENAVKLLIELGARADARDEKGNTALMQAAEINASPSLLRFLLKQELTDAEARNHDGDTALSLAAQNGYVDAAEVLIKQGKVNPNDKVKNGKTVLMLAAAGNKINMIRLLANNKANPNLTDDNGDSALKAAVAANQLNTVRMLLNQGANPNIKDSDGLTPLQVAVRRNPKTDIMLCLLRSGADASVKDSEGKTILQIAAANSERFNHSASGILKDGTYVQKNEDKFLQAAARGNTKTVLSMLKKNPELISARDIAGANALILAGENGRTETMKALLEQGANANSRNFNGRSLLMHLAETGTPETIRMALKAGAKIARRSDFTGRDAVLEAIAADQPDNLKELIKAGAKTDNVDLQRMSAFDLAIKHSPSCFLILLETKNNKTEIPILDVLTKKMAQEHQVIMLEACLRHGADVNVKNRAENTPVLAAASAGNVVLTRILCKHKADLTDRDRFENTVLLRALNDADVVRTLLRYGADIKAKNSRGKDAFKIARENGDMAVIAALQNFGAVEEVDQEALKNAKLPPRERELKEAFARVSRILNADLMGDPDTDRQLLDEKIRVGNKLLKDFKDLKGVKNYTKIQKFVAKQYKLRNELVQKK